ncbi:MAG: hypothetical protein KatS3mg115_0532 [Candidatus Poribacteria bacterium]|nr:MAG: hypothetical protein KatS3mg115_0532 [Candidatus Poribacteria bacterium]
MRLGLYCCWALVVVGWVNPKTSTAEPSLLLNGTFETGTEGWSLSLWPSGEPDEVARAFFRTERVAHSGQASLAVDTSAFLGRELTLVANGRIGEGILSLRGREVVVSGWVYAEPGTALRPMRMRLRTFGRNPTGESVYVGDGPSLVVYPELGRWSRFQARGRLPEAEFTSADLHCSIRPDLVPTRFYLDDLRVEADEPPALQLSVLRDALWSDERTLPVQVRWNPARWEGGPPARIRFVLLSEDGQPVEEWSRPAQETIFGLVFSRPLEEGSYHLRAELLDPVGGLLATDERPLIALESPWKGMPSIQLPDEKESPSGDAVPEAYLATGTQAPTDLPDRLPVQAEPESPDLDLSEEATRGYVVFSRHYLEPSSRRARPRPGEVGPVRLFAARGEYEPATLSVWAQEPLKALKVKAGPLLGERGATIGAEQVSVRLVREIEGLPRFLERRESVDLNAGETATFWVIVHVPEGVEPGFYRGEMTVSAARRPTTRVDLILRVLPFVLPRSKKGYGFWWKMDARWNGYYSQERQTALEQIRRQFVLLREYGVNSLSIYSLPRMTRDATGAFHFDFQQQHWNHDPYSFAEIVQLGKETGLFSPAVPLQYPGAEALHSQWIRFDELTRESPEFDAFYREAVRRIDEWAKEQGITLAFAVVDEIGNSEERRREALRFYRLATEADVLTSVTDNSMHGGVHLMGQERFDAIVRMRVYNFIVPEMIEDARASGDSLWLYNLSSGGWDGKRDRFLFGRFTERVGAEGNLQWAFQWPSGNRSPYQAAAAGERTGYHYALPAPDGPLPTLGLEGVREGIDDARYLELLRRRRPERVEALLEDIPLYSFRIEEYLDSRGGASFEAWRWRVAREILRAESGFKR